MNGIFPPLPTPFREDGGLELGLLSALVDELNGTGLSGYLALGSNGEAVHVDEEEAELVVRTVRAAAATGMTLLAGTGRLSTRATIEATKRAAGAGAAGLSSAGATGATGAAGATAAGVNATLASPPRRALFPRLRTVSLMVAPRATQSSSRVRSSLSSAGLVVEV